VKCPGGCNSPRIVTRGGGGFRVTSFNPLNAELNTICHLLALLGAHHIFHVSELRVKHRVLLLHLSTVTWLRRRPRSEVEFALAMDTAQPVVE
jgi:hypothetical protein